jgi:hypothetical protein
MLTIVGLTSDVTERTLDALNTTHDIGTIDARSNVLHNDHFHEILGRDNQGAKLSYFQQFLE